MTDGKNINKQLALYENPVVNIGFSFYIYIVKREYTKAILEEINIKDESNRLLRYILDIKNAMIGMIDSLYLPSNITNRQLKNIYFETNLAEIFSEQDITETFPNLPFWELVYYKSLSPDIPVFQADRFPKATFFYTFKNLFDKKGIQTESIKKAFLKHSGKGYEVYGFKQQILFVFEDNKITLDQVVEINKEATEILFGTLKVTLPKQFDLIVKCFIPHHLREESESNIKNEIKNIKIKDLPKLLILSDGCYFNTIALNPLKTMVVMDFFSMCVSKSGIDGNIYLSEEAKYYPVSIEPTKIGNNIILGPKCDLASSYVGDNVIIGANALIEPDSKIGNSVYIKNNVRIMTGQEIPAGQTISAELPVIYGKMKYRQRLDYNTFLNVYTKD